MNDPELVKMKAKEVTSPTVKQIYYEGKTGLAITFATPRETGQIHSIEKASKGNIQCKSIPTVTEARESI